VRTLAAQVLSFGPFPFPHFCLHRITASSVHCSRSRQRQSRPMTPHWLQPSRSALHASIHQLTAMAWMRSRWASQFTLVFFRRGWSFFNSSSSELLQLCGFNWRVWCEGRQGDRARVHLWVHKIHIQRVRDRYLFLVLFLVFLFCGFHWRVWTWKTTLIRWALRENNEMLILNHLSISGLFGHLICDLNSSYLIWYLWESRFFFKAFSVLHTGYLGQITQLVIGSYSSLRIQPD